MSAPKPAGDVGVMPTGCPDFEIAAPRPGRNLPHRGEILHERAEGVRAYGNRILRLDVEGRPMAGAQAFPQ